MRKFFSLFLMLFFFLFSSCLTEARQITTPNVAIKYDDHYYQLYDLCMTWEEAQMYCESIGGHLATITSQEENDFLFGYLTSLGYSSAFFGASDKDSDGIWTWVTGEPFQYSNWHEGEPDNLYAEGHYGMFDFKYRDGTWNDGSSGTDVQDICSIPFLCEWDSLDTSQQSQDTGNLVFSNAPNAGNPVRASAQEKNLYVSETSTENTASFGGIYINLHIDNLSFIDLSFLGIGCSSIIGFICFLFSKIKKKTKKKTTALPNKKYVRKRRR